MSSSLYRQQLEKWLSMMHVKCDSCLDVGGGQKSIKERVGFWSVKTYKVLDNDAQFKPDYFEDLNYEINLSEEVTLMPGNIPAVKVKAFDVIFCLEVMEYIFDPLTAHKNIYNLLKPGGIAYISYPTIYPLHNPPKIDFLRYTKNAIEKLLGEAGFRTWEITPRVATNGARALADFYSLEQMRPMKGTTEIFDLGYMCKVFK